MICLEEALCLHSGPGHFSISFSPVDLSFDIFDIRLLRTTNATLLHWIVHSWIGVVESDASGASGHNCSLMLFFTAEMSCEVHLPVKLPHQVTFRKKLSVSHMLNQMFPDSGELSR